MTQLAEQYYRLLIRAVVEPAIPISCSRCACIGDGNSCRPGWGKLNDIEKVIGFFTDLGHTGAGR